MKDIIVDPATKFSFNPAEFVPFKDRAVCAATYIINSGITA